MFEEFRKYLDSRIQVSDEQFDKISKILVFKKAHKGEVLIMEGENCPHIYFVLKGCLRSYCIVNKKEHVMQFAPENWWIGDKFLIIKPEPAMINIGAIEDSSLILFTSDIVEQIMKIVPEADMMFQELKQNRFRSLQKRILSLISVDADERYQDFIRTYPGLAQRVPLQMIASYLGLTPQSLSRLRSRKANKPI